MAFTNYGGDANKDAAPVNKSTGISTHKKITFSSSVLGAEAVNKISALKRPPFIVKNRHININ